VTPLPLLLALLGPAQSHTLRAVVRVDADGVHLEQAILVPGELRQPPRSGAGPSLELVDDQGRVLAAYPIPDSLTRSVILPDGGGATAVLDQAMAVVTLPWEEGAVAVRLDQQRLQPSPPPPGMLEPVSESGPSDERLDIVFLGDGYTAKELDRFAEDVDRMVEHILSLEPYGAYSGLFNVWRIDQASTESGVSHNESLPPQVRDTAYGCFYGCGGVDSLLCCEDYAVVSELQSLVPGYDGAVVLVNDPTYGGSSGWTYATSYNGAQGPEVTAHELGHSLVGLWDEYSYGSSYSGADGPNCSCNPDALPWDHWLDLPSVDAYPTCSYTNYHRPTSNDCMMRSLQDQYCPVCREQAVLAIYGQLPGMVASTEPPQGPVAVEPGEVLTFSAQLLGPDDAPVAIWLLDGEPVGEGTSLTLEGDSLTLEGNCGTEAELLLQLSDPTEWVRADPGGLLTDQVSWTLQGQACDTAEPEDSGISEDSQERGDEPGPLCGCASGHTAGSGMFLLSLLGLTTRRRRSAAQPQR